MMFYRWISRETGYLHQVEADSYDEAEQKFEKNESVCIDEKETWEYQSIFVLAAKLKGSK